MDSFNRMLGRDDRRPHPPRRRRTYLRGGGQRLTVAQKRQVKKMVELGKEKKYFDYNIAYNTDITSGGLGGSLFTNISAVPQGDGDSERIGDQLRMTSLQYKLTLDAGGASVTAGNPYWLRYILFRWKPDNANDAPSVITEILENSTDVLSLPVGEDAQRKKFEIIQDKFIALSGRGSGTDNWHKEIIGFEKMNGKLINFNNTGVSGSGHLYILVVATHASANVTEMAGNFRLYYTE